MAKHLNKVPKEPYAAFAWFVSRCASGFYTELVEQGRSDTQARLAAVHCFLDFAAGEACRIARHEGRNPDPKKWRKATTDSFKRAVARTKKQADAARLINPLTRRRRYER